LDRSNVEVLLARESGLEAQTISRQTGSDDLAKDQRASAFLRCPILALLGLHCLLPWY